MSTFARLVLIFLVVKSFHLTDGYSRGAPQEACSNMEPQHGPEPQMTPSPFSVIPQQNNIEQGGTVKVSIGAQTGREKFEGFMLMAVSPSDTSKPVGRFIDNPRPARSVDCPSGEQNALTHRDAKKKDKLEVTWEAPADFKGEIEFRCTFARDFSTIWLQVPASSLVQVGPVESVDKENGKNSAKPLVTIFDYFVWRIWFAMYNLNQLR